MEASSKSVQAMTRALVVLLCSPMLFMLPCRAPDSHLSGSYEVAIRPEVMSAVNAQYPMVVSTNAAADEIVLKTKFDAESQLIVATSQGKRLASITEDDTQIGSALSPDGQSIAYYSHPRNKGLYYPEIWSPKTHLVKKLKVPPSLEANAPLRWSPDGSELLYAEKGHDRLMHLYLIDLKNKEPEFTEIGTIVGTEVYSWAHRSNRFVTCLKADPNRLVVFNSAGTLESRVLIAHSMTLQGVTWSWNEDRLTLSARTPNSDWFTIIEIEVKSGKSETCFKERADLTDPVALPNGSVLLGVNSGGSTVLGNGFCRNHKFIVVGPQEGTVYLRSTSIDGQTINAYYLSPTEPPSLISIHIQAESERYHYIYRSPQYLQLTVAEPVRISIPSTKGDTMLGTIWPAQSNNRSKRVVVVNVHGGPHIQDGVGWALQNKLITSEGADYMTFNYHGSTGFGKSFEKIESVEQQVDDIISACEYAKKKILPPGGMIILEGVSFGAYLSLRTVLRRQDLIDGILINSLLLAGDIAYPSKDMARIRVRQFYGEDDPSISSEQARATSEKVFGSDIFDGRRGVFCTLKGESHVFWGNDSIARLYSGLADLIQDSR